MWVYAFYFEQHPKTVLMTIFIRVLTVLFSDINSTRFIGPTIFSSENY